MLQSFGEKVTNLILVIAEIVDHHVVVDLLVSDIVLSSFHSLRRE